MELKKNKFLEVNAIKNGTVIDHIPVNSLFKVISILGLDKIDKTITFGINLESKKLGKKAIIKLSEVFFKDEDINKIALVAPQAKLNIIRDYHVIEKRIVEVPDEIIGIVKCINPVCITNAEKITTRFYVIKKDSIKLKCHYCEKIIPQENIIII